MLIKGANLNDSQRRLVLNAFPYRWTTGNSQREYFWRNVQGKPTMPLQSDDQWLSEHAFHFTADGKRMMANRRHAEPVYMAGGKRRHAAKKTGLAKQLAALKALMR